MQATVSIKDPTLQTHREISPGVLKVFPFELVIMARGMFVKAYSAVWKTAGFPSLAQGLAQSWQCRFSGPIWPWLGEYWFYPWHETAGGHVPVSSYTSSTLGTPEARSWHLCTVTVLSRITGLREGNMMFPNFGWEVVRNSK